MQLPALDAALPTALPTAAGVPARVVAGNLASIPLGSLLRATVTTVAPREAVLTVNGQALTVRPPAGVQLQAGAVLLVRVPPTAPNATNPTLELGVPTNAVAHQTAAGTTTQQPPTGTAARVPERVNEVAAALPNEIGRAASTAPPPPARARADGAKPATPAPPRLAVVDVLTARPDGRLNVSIDGEEQIATASNKLVPGERYVLQVARTPAGFTLKPPPNSPALPTDVATAILRSPAPALPATLNPLQAELTALATPQPAGSVERPIPVAVRAAATVVTETLRTFVPNEPRPPDATELQQLIEKGGQLYEAKLARLGTDPVERRDSTATPTSPAPGSERSAREVGPDLKGDLLRLLQTVQDLGGAARAPAAQAALTGVEAQQAANTLAQVNGTPYFLQVPFPDGEVWRTLHLSLEPQHQPDQPDAERAGRFRVFMHVPLTDLGETWIDAGLAGDRFRATIFLDRADVRDRVRAALTDLHTELQTEGFAEVLLDVRAAAELPARHRREASAMQAGRPATVSVLDVRA